MHRSDPVPEQEYLTREQLFDMKRPRRDMPTDNDVILKKAQRLARESRHTPTTPRPPPFASSAAPTPAGGVRVDRAEGMPVPGAWQQGADLGGSSAPRKRVRESRASTTPSSSRKMARTEHGVGGMSTPRDYSQHDFSNRKHSCDFATVGVNDRHVPRRTIVSHEVLVSTVYVSHRLYKLKSELLNIVGLMADFGLYWEALSMDHQSGGRRGADMFIRYIQGASSPHEVLHAITTLETVIPLAGMTRGEHREAIEGMLCSAMGQPLGAGAGAEAGAGAGAESKGIKEPLPRSAVTASTVATRLFSLDRIIRYERLPAIYTEYLMKSPTICRTRCDHSARCPFSLCCNKMIGHFGRCMPNVETASRMPDIRPPFDRMVTGEIAYAPDLTALCPTQGGLGGPGSLTQFSGLPLDGGRGGGSDPLALHRLQGLLGDRSSSKANPYVNPHFVGAPARIELITIKVIPFDIREVQPHIPEGDEVTATEWV
jgi:hypothetical protein